MWRTAEHRFRFDDGDDGDHLCGQCAQLKLEQAMWRTAHHHCRSVDHYDQYDNNGDDDGTTPWHGVQVNDDELSFRSHTALSGWWRAFARKQSWESRRQWTGEIVKIRRGWVEEYYEWWNIMNDSVRCWEVWWFCWCWRWCRCRWSGVLQIGPSLFHGMWSPLESSIWQLL